MICNSQTKFCHLSVCVSSSTQVENCASIFSVHLLCLFLLRFSSSLRLLFSRSYRHKRFSILISHFIAFCFIFLYFLSTSQCEVHTHTYYWTLRLSILFFTLFNFFPSCCLLARVFSVAHGSFPIAVEVMWPYLSTTAAILLGRSFVFLV